MLAVETAGGGAEHLVRLTVYVVDWDIAKLPEFMAGMGAAVAATSLPRVPASLIAVHRLYEPHHQVEIEATAVIPA